MIIPKNVKVGNFIYDVEICDTPIIHEGVLCQGLCSYSEQKIWLSNDLTQQSLEQTFLHELCHAIFFHLGMSFDQDTEEVVEKTSIILHGIIKDNPLIFVEQETIDEFFNKQDVEEFCNKENKCGCGGCKS